MPSPAPRSARLAALPAPLTRRIPIALSSLPSASSSARLASIIPAPVRSRRAFTSFAFGVNVAIGLAGLLGRIEASLGRDRLLVALGPLGNRHRTALGLGLGRRIGFDLACGDGL